MNAILTILRVLAKIWKALPNRLVAVFVFFGGVGAVFWIYASFFVLDVSTIDFKVTGVASAEVTLVGSFRTAGMYGSISGGTGATCVGTCLFQKMPPVSYVWTASADGFETASGSFDLPARTIFPVRVQLSPTIRYEAYSPDNVRRAAEARVRRDIDLFLSGAARKSGGRPVRPDPSLAALSGAAIWLPVSGGRALLRSDAFDGGWAWWGMGRWAPLFPGQVPPAALGADPVGGVVLMRDAGASALRLVDVRSGQVVPVLPGGDFASAARGSSATRYLLKTEADAVEYDASALAAVRTLTGARDAAFLPDGSYVSLAADGSTARVEASGAVLRWPSPEGVQSLFASGPDLVVGLGDGSWRVARAAADQARTLAK